MPLSSTKLCSLADIPQIFFGAPAHIRRSFRPWRAGRSQEETAPLSLLGDLGAARGFSDLVSRVGGTQTFATGLYARSEMFVDGLLDLYTSGILKRRVYAHEDIQRGLNDGRITEAIDSAGVHHLSGSVLEQPASR